MRSVLVMATVASSLLRAEGYVQLRRTTTPLHTSPWSRTLARPFSRAPPLWASAMGSYHEGSEAQADFANSGASVVHWDWEQMATNVFSDDTRPIVLFDGVCNLCNGGVNFAIDQDEDAKLRFCSLQSRVARSLLLRAGKSLDDKSNIALVTEDAAYFSSDAVSRIAKDLDSIPLQWLGHAAQFTHPWIRESVYKFVSEHRYQFGENDSCRLDFDGTYTSRFVSEPSQEIL